MMPTSLENSVLYTTRGIGKDEFAKNDAFSRALRVGDIYDLEDYCPEQLMIDAPQEAYLEAKYSEPDGDDGCYCPDETFEAEQEASDRYDRDAWRRQFEIEEMLLDCPREVGLEKLASEHTPPLLTRGMKKAVGYTPRRQRRAHRAARNNGKVLYGSNCRHSRREKERFVKELLERIDNAVKIPQRIEQEIELLAA